MSDCFFFLFFVRVRKLIATFDGQEILSFLLWRWCRGVYIESGCCAILPWGYFNVFGTMWTGCEKLRIWRETAKYVLTILWGNISRMLFLFYLMYRWCSMIWVRLLSYFDVNGPNLTFFLFFTLIDGLWNLWFVDCCWGGSCNLSHSSPQNRHTKKKNKKRTKTLLPAVVFHQVM